MTLNRQLFQPQTTPDLGWNMTSKAVATTGGMEGNNTGEAVPCLYDIGKDVVGIFYGYGRK
ncbi:hypothetical protein NG796_05620 [Laspinema sp. A4]|uniref:hypothetical protein n=1 Tax=Laspinema sp. D2d TaxID=2953686 RepID=UPI0021BB3556|nr:hypothetical protein [Laspinema sp. D2d]MCT7982770.1 hypothetical protein [Laspinema sp. D2d]